MLVTGHNCLYLPSLALLNKMLIIGSNFSSRIKKLKKKNYIFSSSIIILMNHIKALFRLYLESSVIRKISLKTNKFLNYLSNNISYQLNVLPLLLFINSL